eukprot:TRINITY_DN9317_c0_g1_i3.p2 TRINITY_DN9317_c0_g1~~TRINITY_DN9317_c0_g1_i3.p2  ORF type:complete len:104 (-),score=42.76 TRINITY_DN9317_c0_g1_i3:62-373(-)
MRSDQRNREMKLVRMLDMIFGHLGRLTEITEQLEEMAVRHISYEVYPEDYAVLGEALFYTMRQCLQSRFTPEMEEAWRGVYGLLSDTCIRAAAPYYAQLNADK